MFFVGNNGSGISRRSVITFDVGSKVPVGSTVTAVTLTLHVSMTRVGSRAIGLHKLIADWGEGTSNSSSGGGGGGASSTAGDATWIHRFFDTQLWETLEATSPPRPARLSL